MTDEARMFLAKAVKLLNEADMMLSVNLDEAAGRSAYLAAFHAAQALIFEHLGKVLKTHAGVHAEFLRLTRNDPRLDADLRVFLLRSYNLKAIADYETDPETGVTRPRAEDAVATGRRFVACIEGMIG